MLRCGDIAARAGGFSPTVGAHYVQGSSCVRRTGLCQVEKTARVGPHRDVVGVFSKAVMDRVWPSRGAASHGGINLSAGKRAVCEFGTLLRQAELK